MASACPYPHQLNTLVPTNSSSPSLQPAMEEGTFSPAAHTTTGLPDATLRRTGCFDKREAGEGGRAQKSLPPALRHTETGQAGYCPGRRPLPGASGSEPEAVPSASDLEGGEQAETSASLNQVDYSQSLPLELGRVVPCTSLAQLLPSFSAQLQRVLPEAPRGPPAHLLGLQRSCPYLCPGGLRGDGPGASISVIPWKVGDRES